MPEFAHLHCHTQYSLLDGAARIKRLVGRAAEMEMAALAITDHGNLYGVPEFYTSCNKAGVQPIVGCEFYVTPSGMDDKSDRTRYHQVLLAKNLEGYRNLIKLSSLSYTDGYYYKPRIDRDTLRAHSAGLIATTCCLQGEVLQTILKKGEEEGERVFREWLELFGEDYYIELQDHAIPEQRQCNAVLVKWAEKYGVQTIATNDVHYVEQADAEAQDILLCLQTGKDYHDPNRMRFENDQFFLKSIPEMQTAFADSIAQGAFASDKDVDAALDGTLAVAAKCALDIPMGDLLMPHFPLPEQFGSNMGAYLRHLSFEGAKRRYNGTVPEPVRERIDLELSIIGSMGFDGYFLIVQDFTTAARDLGVSVGPGRGSAAGSIVAYCLGITNIDPLEYDLLFERFLNPERVSMPDIDIDFDDRGRGKVIDYVVEKYGRESVCQIVTYGTMGAKSVVKDVARVMGVPLDRAIEITKMIPDGVKVSLEKAQKAVPEFAKLWKSEDVQIRKMMHYCEVLEGSARHTGVHAAGVIIAPGDVSDYVPVAIQKGKSGAADAVVTQYDGKWVEDFGLLKMDFLGLKTLTILDDALQLVEENHGVKLDLDALPLDDQKTYRLFQKGDTVAIFQFESSGMREWMRKLKPTSIDDLIAMNALYRPGPMDLIPNYIARKHGTEKVEYPHPMLEEILRPTYGIPVYQEQVMQMAQVMGGYTLGGADLLRRAMGKKKQSEMDKQRVIFVDGAAEKGVPAEKANEVFDMMAKFAGYGFNKCVVAETEVTNSATGARTTVGDLFDRRDALAAEPFTIHALDDAGRLNPRRVEDVVWNGVKLVYELTTSLGKRIVATGNHPFRTLGGWTNLENLAPGDRIAAPRVLSVETDASWPEHELIALAGLIAEGNTCHPSTLYFYGNDRTLVEDFANAIGQFPNTVARIDERKNGRLEVAANTGRDTRFGSTPPWNKRGVKVQAPTRSGAFRWAERLGLLGKKADAKFVPAEVFSLCDADLALFLGRLWAGDGFIANRTNHTPYYATSSEQLARDVQTLLLRLGLVSRVKAKVFKYRGTERPGYTVHLLGEGTLPRFLDVIAPHIVGRDAQVDEHRRYASSTKRGLTSKDTIPADVRAWVNEERQGLGLTWTALETQAGVSVKEFYGSGSKGKRGFRRATIAKLARFFASERLAAVAESDVYWDEVVAITPMGERDTYDLTVEHDHNFVADGLIVHNSHSAAYSVVAYHTAYLKAHYPAEFMAAVLTTEMADSKKLAIALDATRSAGIELLPPDVNTSRDHFTVETVNGKHCIRFGLGAIKGVGHGAVEAIENGRTKEDGRFTSIFTMCKALDLRTVGKRTVEALAAAGALDSLEGHRAQLVQAVDLAWQHAQTEQANELEGKLSLFGEDTAHGSNFEPALPMVEPWGRGQKLREERDLIGFYVSGHPLDDYAAEARTFSSVNLADTEDVQEGRDAAVCGIVTEVTRRTTKSGRPMAFLSVEDTEGACEVVLFSNTFEKHQHLLKVDEVLLIRGKAENRGGLKLIARDLLPMWRVRDELVKAITIRLDAEATDAEELEAFAHLCEQNRGEKKLYFEVAHPAVPRPVRLRSRTAVIDPTPEVMRGMQRLAGRDGVVLETSS
ncbi:MAG: DNA polymerase III subunit alpha [Bacteroidota bacterium]